MMALSFVGREPPVDPRPVPSVDVVLNSMLSPFAARTRPCEICPGEGVPAHQMEYLHVIEDLRHHEAPAWRDCDPVVYRCPRTRKTIRVSVSSFGCDNDQRYVSCPRDLRSFGHGFTAESEHLRNLRLDWAHTIEDDHERCVYHYLRWCHPLPPSRLVSEVRKKLLLNRALRLTGGAASLLHWEYAHDIQYLHNNLYGVFFAGEGNPVASQCDPETCAARLDAEYRAASLWLREREQYALDAARSKKEL